MKKIFLLVFLISNAVAAQNQMQQNAMKSFMTDFNNNDFEKIYQSFSAKMQQARTKQHYFNFLSRVKKDRGNLRSVELTNYTENAKKKTSRAQYLGNFDYGSAIIRITMNAQNKIIGLYIIKENLL